jgi:hypothetical protein
VRGGRRGVEGSARDEGAEAGGPCSVLRDFSGLGLATDEGGDELRERP